MTGKITPAQVRAARGLVDWSQSVLAARTRVGRSTIRKFEAGRISPVDDDLASMRVALESAGVAFIAANGGGAGVRLSKER